MSDPAQPGKIVVVSAPSGGGKTTLLDYLRCQIPELVYSISATTRPPRAHEINGVHYFFMTVDEFKRKIDKNEFAEWQCVHDNFYGTPRSFLDTTVAQGRTVVMDIDVFGKKKFDLLYPEAIGILVVPPSMEILEKRLRSRATDSEQVIRTRLENARVEMEFARAEGKYEHIVINDKLDDACTRIEHLVRNIIHQNQ